MNARALSVRQPFADLIVGGGKRYETRSWKTKYRGPFVLHASGRPQPGQRTRLLLAVATLADVVPVESLDGHISAAERAAGDFSAGRFAWRLEDIRPLPSPIPYLGGLSWWRIDDLTTARIARRCGVTFGPLTDFSDEKGL